MGVLPAAACDLKTTSTTTTTLPPNNGVHSSETVTLLPAAKLKPFANVPNSKPTLLRNKPLLEQL
ncbi:hypothetical protein HanXRQr2_Chr09g0382811 [Helianthus annuus]|uniref:Uncharacterized protein n=1 Tax=Helianthus annuus TaxID=4232 RepID=A0A9K3N7W8_HELAN|nr:hypothetical protein HanXRQr2_Chr09g0382811 [Helianthus annuus]